jgi:hypothetical protein
MGLQPKTDPRPVVKPAMFALPLIDIGYLSGC